MIVESIFQFVLFALVLIGIGCGLVALANIIDDEDIDR